MRPSPSAWLECRFGVFGGLVLAMADDEEQYRELLNWAADQGITDVAEDEEAGAARSRSTCLGFALEISIFPDAGGRGLSAARDLKLGDLILRVPERVLMNGRSARKDMEFAQALSCYPMMTDVQVLCLHLLKEVAKGRTSAWYPYLVHLPRSYHTAAYYTTHEAQALQVEEAVWMAEQAAEKARGEWMSARLSMEKLRLARRFTTLHAWLWASATVSSRTLFVPWDEAGTLCPVGDYFNYACPGVSYGEFEREVDVMSEDASDTSGGLELRDRLRDGGFEPKRNEYCFYARQHYKKGQQVLLCYGTYTNLELLEHYGFLLPYNPNDKVHMRLPSTGELSPGDSWVFQETIPLKNVYIDYKGQPSFSLLLYLRLAAAPATLRKSRRHLAFAGQQISPESDLVVYQWLKTKCHHTLMSFPTSMHVDELLFAILKVYQSTEEVRNFWSVHKEKDITSVSRVPSEALEGVSFEVQEVIKHEFENFLESVSLKGKLLKGRNSSLEDLKFERWKLAVEWRLGHKRILDRCISHCSFMLR